MVQTSRTLTLATGRRCLDHGVTGHFPADPEKMPSVYMHLVNVVSSTQDATVIGSDEKNNCEQQAAEI